eukprot:c19196_g1_i1 orf=195-494(-)
MDILVRRLRDSLWIASLVGGCFYTDGVLFLQRMYLFCIGSIVVIYTAKVSASCVWLAITLQWAGLIHATAKVGGMPFCKVFDKCDLILSLQVLVFYIAF